MPHWRAYRGSQSRFPQIGSRIRRYPAPVTTIRRKLSRVQSVAVAEMALQGPDAERVGEAGGDRCRQMGGVPTDMAAKLKALERENREFRRDPAQGKRLFCPGGTRPPGSSYERVYRRSTWGARVEPICRLPYRPTITMSPSPPTREAIGSGRSGSVLKPEIERVFAETFEGYDARNVGSSTGSTSRWYAAPLSA